MPVLPRECRQISPTSHAASPTPRVNSTGTFNMSTHAIKARDSLASQIIPIHNSQAEAVAALEG